MEILREARRRGYAENLDETALGLHCLAAPVGPPGRVVAAITLCVPSGRMSAARKREMIPDLLRAAREIVPQPESGGGVAGGPGGAAGDGAHAATRDSPANGNPSLDGDPASSTNTSLIRSSKFQQTLGASIPRGRGRGRRPEPNRKVAP
jgi:hypothetical protein